MNEKKPNLISNISSKHASMFSVMFILFFAILFYRPLTESNQNNGFRTSKRETSREETEPNNSEHQFTKDFRFVVMSDIHSMASYSWANTTENRDLDSYKDKLRVLTHINDNYGGEFVALPGDIASYGPLSLDTIVRRIGGDLPVEEAVYKAGRNCFNTTRQLFRDAGYSTLLATIGDHDIGGNEGFRVDYPVSKLRTIPQARLAFGDGFNRDDDGGFLFEIQRWFDNKDVGVTSRPLGTPYENTTFAYVHNNVLFVTVDAFELVGDGTKNFIDRENGLGGEGSVTCTVDGGGLHLLWLENILRKGRDDSSISHIIVQSHLPIVQQIRKVSCSGQFLDYGEDSNFWRLMNQYGVDIYLAGEG